MRLGANTTSLRQNGLGSTKPPTEVTCKKEPLSTMMEEGWAKEGGLGEM
jgi:hypothetical protein